MSALRRLSDALALVERWICRGLIVAFTLLLVLNAGLRYGAGRPLFFAEELAVLILVWMGFIAISLSLHANDQVRITLVTERLGRRTAARVEIVVQVVVAAILAALLWSAVAWLRSPSVEFERAIALDLPKAPFFAIIPVFCATALLHTLARIGEIAAAPASAPAGANASCDLDAPP